MTGKHFYRDSSLLVAGDFSHKGVAGDIGFKADDYDQFFMNFKNTVRTWKRVRKSAELFWKFAAENTE